MPSSRFYLYGGTFFDLLGYSGVLPYSWNVKTGTLIKSRKLRKKSLCVFALFNLWGVYLFFNILFYYQIRDFTKFNLCYVFFIGGCLIINCFALIHWPNYEGLITFNTILDYSKYVGKFQTF